MYTTYTCIVLPIPVKLVFYFLYDKLMLPIPVKYCLLIGRQRIATLRSDWLVRKVVQKNGHNDLRICALRAQGKLVNPLRHHVYVSIANESNLF